MRILVAGGVQVCDKPGEPCLLYKYTQRQPTRGGGGLTGFRFHEKFVGAAPHWKSYWLRQISVGGATEAFGGLTEEVHWRRQNVPRCLH